MSAIALHNIIYQHNRNLFVCLHSRYSGSIRQLNSVNTHDTLNIVKKLIVNALNILFTLILFSPFVYTQTTSKLPNKIITEKKLPLKIDNEQPTEQNCLTNRH
jgi:hypothetical protein